METCLEEIEGSQCPEYNYIAYRCPTHKSYWPQWKSLSQSVRDGILERHWESADRRSKILVVRIVSPPSEQSEGCAQWWAIRRALWR
jgi:hypothetical protein